MPSDQREPNANRALRLKPTDPSPDALGMRADLNIIDFDRLALAAPIVTYDLPARGRRLRQPAQAYVSTLTAGTVIAEDGVDTGMRPGRLIRGAKARPENSRPQGR